MTSDGRHIDLNKIKSEKVEADEDAAKKEQAGFEQDLERRAGSAAYRAEVAAERHVTSLTDERDRLRNQVDQLSPLVSRVAEMEQSERTAKANGGVAALATIIGGTSLSISSVYGDGVAKWAWFSVGIALIVVAISILFILRVFNWPPEKGA